MRGHIEQDQHRTVSRSLPLIEQLLHLSRPANFALPLLGILIGYQLAGGAITTGDKFLVALIIVIFAVHSAITIANDLADRKIDRDNHVTTAITHDDRRVLQASRVSVWLLLGVAAITAFGFPLPVTLIIFAMIVGGLAYDFPPLRLSYRPISSIVCLAVLYGGLPLLAGSFLVGAITPGILAVALFWTLGRASLSILKDFKDVRGDKKWHKQTFLIRFGTPATLQASFILGVVGYIGSALALYLNGMIEPGREVAFLIVSAIFAALIVWQRLQLLRSPDLANDLFHRYLLWQLAYEGIFLAWLIRF